MLRTDLETQGVSVTWLVGGAGEPEERLDGVGEPIRGIDAQERSNLDQPGFWVGKGCKGKGKLGVLGRNRSQRWIGRGWSRKLGGSEVV